MRKNSVRFEIWTCSVWFYFIYLFVLTFEMKLKGVNYNIHLNILVIETIKKWCQIEHVLCKKVSFCFMSIDWVHFNHKTETFQFWKSLKSFNIFWANKWCQTWKCPARSCLTWVKIRYLSRILGISWEIQILNFIEIVWYFSIKESIVRSKFAPVLFLSYLYLFVLFIFL